MSRTDTTELLSLGWDDRLAAAYRPFDGAEFCPARVTRVDRAVCRALTASGALRASLGGDLLDRAARDPAALPCPGDWIVVRVWPDARTTIEAVLPRRSILQAPAGPDRASEILAANIDSLAVVEPMDQAPDLDRVERLRRLAQQSDVPPAAVLTHVDRLGTVISVTPDVEVYPLNMQTGLGALCQQVTVGRTLALLGTGSALSDVVDALVGANVMGIREQHRDGRGRPATSAPTLLPVPGGGALLVVPETGHRLPSRQWRRT
jgi:ribosome biogenesis GTPase / thiamine phosphate phosphatase